MQAKRSLEAVDWTSPNSAALRRQMLTTFATAFLAEAGEHRLECRAFSLSRFIYFQIHRRHPIQADVALCDDVMPSSPNLLALPST